MQKPGKGNSGQTSERVGQGIPPIGTRSPRSRKLADFINKPKNSQEGKSKKEAAEGWRDFSGDPGRGEQEASNGKNRKVEDLVHVLPQIEFGQIRGGEGGQKIQPQKPQGKKEPANAAIDGTDQK